ncbi:hypothetical protein JO972_09385 [Verrucomicrobiaceae bacterium 5K15]|uniref:Uncharacterized protein n=1 Tax=Oceaniferula flava TaxID=2800421 RepID=A0AAE2SB34_9BACT|nr:hypothetical protein [Oceaniferula flavus]MBK1855168.1 hypothetical protein [Oceaniferula flavus]MBM1136474.1 hypothetical protein [Oceaniferula flavus]
MRCPFLFPLKPALAALCVLLTVGQAVAHSPGDLMIVGYKSSQSPSDSISFVTWVELAAGESLILIDADYSGGGDGTGQGLAGGSYESLRSITWTNGSSALPPGTVITIPDVTASTPSPNIGSCTRSGNFALTNQGEQIFLAQGTIVDSGGNDYLNGQLIFGLDYEGSGGWGESGESALPSVLNVVLGNINMGEIDDAEFPDINRNGKAISDYSLDVVNPSKWQSVGSESLSSTIFNDDSVAEMLGAVSPGLLFHTRRMNNKLPILDESWSISQGATGDNIENLNGASCIRIPNWIPANERADPTAVYYLYFADHSGNYIRMAWAANIEGPWTGFRMNENTYPDIGDRGVLSLGDDDEIDAGDGLMIDGHIASPDVLIDDTNQRIIMYFHGQVWFTSEGRSNSRSQRTISATSSDGLNFNMPSGGDSRAGQSGHGVLSVNYGESYFRIFEEGGRQYALTNTGDLYGAPVDSSNVPLDPLVPNASYNHTSRYWDQGPKPFTDETESRGWLDWGNDLGALRPRHFGVLKRDGLLYAFYTNKGEIGERVKISTFDFANLPSGSELSFEDWHGVFPSQELLRPEENWEGANLPLSISGAGGADDPMHELRDPSVLEDNDGRTYLFYSGSGEKAIGVAQLVSLPVLGGPTEVTTGAAHTFTVATDVDVAPEWLKISKTSTTAVGFDAEEASSYLIHDGNGYAPLQSATVSQGNQSYQLAHSATQQSVTLTLPNKYYATQGATLHFSSRLRSSTTGQFAELQVSFDGVTWQSLWVQRGGSAEADFTTRVVDISGLAGRCFELRFRYQHEPLRNSSIVSGNSSSQGWFIDDIVTSGLETVATVTEANFSSSSFTLDDITAMVEPEVTLGDDVDDRFLISVSGLHAGSGFSESIGYGKPYAVRIRSSYEQFMYDYFSDIERADPLVYEKTADPDGDGIVNLLEHAFGSSPQEPGSNPVHFTGDTIHPSLTFPWNSAAGHSYFLQMGDLQTSFVDVEFTESSEIVEGQLMITLSPAPSVIVPSEKAFFRIKVE